MIDNILEHYGTKGMKWGVRKKSGSGKKKSAKQTVKTLTNKELKKRVDRLNMEKQYVDLVGKSSSSSILKGRAVVTQMVKTAGKQKMQSLITEGVSKSVDMAIAGAKKKIPRG